MAQKRSVKKSAGAGLKTSDAGEHGAPRFLEKSAYILFLIFLTFLPLVYSTSSKSNFILPKQLLYEPVMWLIALIWLTSMALEGKLRFVRSNMYPGVGLFLAICCLSLIKATPLFEGWIELRAWLMAGVGFVLAMNLVRTRMRAWALLVGISLAGVLEAIWAIAQLLNRDFILKIEGNPIGTTGNSNYLGAMLAIFIFPLLAVTLGAWYRLRPRVGSWAATAIGIALIATVGVGIIFSDCQASYIGAGMGLMAFALAMLFLSRIDLKKVARVGIAAVLTVALLFGMARALYGRSLLDFANLGARTTTGRIVMWKATALMIKDHPVLGTGMGTYGFHYLNYLSESLRGKDVIKMLNVIQNTEKPHNAYLQVWSETGSLGIAAFLLMLLIYYFETYKDLKRVDRIDDRFGILGVTCGQFSFLTILGVSSLLVISPMREYFFVFLGLEAGWRRAAGLGSDWEWKPEGWKAHVIAILISGLPAAALVSGAAHSWMYYQANIFWETGIRATDADESRDAVDWYTSALKITPGDHKLAFYRGSLIIKMADTVKEPTRETYLDAGLADLLFATEGYSDVNLFTNLAKVYADRGDLEKALYWYQKAADTGLNYGAAHTNVGVTLLALGRVAEAEKELSTAIAADPDLGWARFNLGLLRMKQKRYSEAVDQFRIYIKQFPKSSDGYNNLGLSLMDSGDVTGSINAFQQSIDNNPKNTRAMNNLGASYFRLGQTERAKAQWQKVLEIDPSNEVARRNIERLGK